MESLTKSLKLLANEVSELKRRSSETNTNRNIFKISFFKKNKNSQSAKFAESSNSLFDVEN